MQIEPYLFFEGRCEEAVEFYRKALGAGLVALLRFRDSPDPGMIPPGMEDKVMHACLRIGDTAVMASDGRCEGKPAFQGFSLSLNLADEAQAQRLFHALTEGGQATMPLAETVVAKRCGRVTDRFGVGWMIVVSPTG